MLLRISCSSSHIAIVAFVVSIDITSLNLTVTFVISTTNIGKPINCCKTTFSCCENHKKRPTTLSGNWSILQKSCVKLVSKHNPHTRKPLIIPGLILNVWHECQMTCSLDCNSKSSLMLCTVPCDTARKNLSSLRDISL